MKIDVKRVRPTHLNVLVRSMEGDKTEGGIIIPMQARNKGERVVKVIAVGPGDVRDGVFVVPPCKAGDEVLVGSGNGYQIDEEHWIMPVHCIIALMEPTEERRLEVVS